MFIIGRSTPTVISWS